jgi:zinc protease
MSRSSRRRGLALAALFVSAGCQGTSHDESVAVHPQAPAAGSAAGSAAQAKKPAPSASSIAGKSGSIADTVHIDFQKFVLPNGLTLIVHEDHKAPIVAVNVWYHVGSKNEKPGKTGFAHLFEHLMFEGSENSPVKWFDPLEKVGATNLNGTTNTDRTNYFENVPKNALDTVLWLESDRMGHLLGNITQPVLDEQRGVVQNEKRQGENRPYGQSQNLITAATAPHGHPYSWTTIGSMEDLNAASLDDVKEWFRSSYGAANATLVIAGDVDPADVKTRVEKFFGDIPSGPPIARWTESVPPLIGTTRQKMEDRVTQPRLTIVWNVAPWGDPSLEYLSLFGDVLAGGRTSRLYQRLIVKEQIATDCRAFVSRRELGSQFMLSVSAKPDVDLRKIESICDEEMNKLVASGPQQDELDRVKSETLAGFVRGLERIGGFGGKSDTLAECQVFGGDPSLYKKRITILEGATVAQVKLASAELAGGGRYILDAVPFPKWQTAKQGADRSKMPDPGTTAEASFPKFTRAKLRNGLEVIVAERHAVPTVELSLQLEGGSASDPEALTGLARMTADLLDEGTTSRTSIQIGEELARLGARLTANAEQDGSTVSLSALKNNLAASLDLFADVVLHPSFPKGEFDRIQKERIVGLQQSRTEPASMGRRVLPLLAYGAGHPYGRLGGGAGTESSLAALTPDELKKCWSTWFKPNHARLIVVGDTTAAEITALLESKLGGWQPGDVPKIEIGPITAKNDKRVVYLIDKPQAPQSIILASMAAPPTGDPADIAFDEMNDVLGGPFTARINMNLREDKHWSYGARSSFGRAKGPRLLTVNAPVQTDKTKESMQEIEKELQGIIGDRPAKPEELDLVKRQSTLSLSGSWETNAAVLGSISQILRYGWPDDYWSTYAGSVRAVTLEQVNAAAKQIITPEKATWIVVGDRAKIEAAIKDAGIGQVIEIDPDGKPIGPQS